MDPFSSGLINCLEVIELKHESELADWKLNRSATSTRRSTSLIAAAACLMESLAALGVSNTASHGSLPVASKSAKKQESRTHDIVQAPSLDASALLSIANGSRSHSARCIDTRSFAGLVAAPRKCRKRSLSYFRTLR